MDGGSTTGDANPGTLEASAPSDCELSKYLPPGDHEFTIKSKNGITYKYTLVMPKTVPAGKKAPLVVVWHALTSSPEETRSLTDVDESSAADGTITVHPRSPDQAWDVGSCCTGAVLAPNRNEEVFARELVIDVKSKVCVDDKRVYTTGFSNGGMMSHMLGCKMADVFAAAAPMGSTLTIAPDQCKPSRPVPIFMINGTADPLVGYASPSFSGGLPVTEAFTFWSQKNQCVGEPVTTLKKGMVLCKTYQKCAAGVEVTLCTVEGMGHCMPGMKKESENNCLTKALFLGLGKPNDDIDGVKESGDFLARWQL